MVAYRSAPQSLYALQLPRIPQPARNTPSCFPCACIFVAMTRMTRAYSAAVTAVDAGSKSIIKPVRLCATDDATHASANAERALGSVERTPIAASPTVVLSDMAMLGSTGRPA